MRGAFWLAGPMTPSELRTLTQVRADLARFIRYDDQSVVADHWGRRGGAWWVSTVLPTTRPAAVATAWHEAGHAVAALAVGARFTSASIHYGGASAPSAGRVAGRAGRGSAGRGSAGRVHGVTGAGAESFVVDAAGQIAERLRDWSMLDTDAALRQWLPTWRRDGGDARRFRQAVAARPAREGWDEVTAWRHSEAVLIPRRLQVRAVARALLVAPRHLPYAVVAAIAQA
jgi:hypothetical protein